MKSSSTLSILLVSDIHEDLNSLDELVNFCKKSSYVPDYIFNLGDIITIPDGQQDDPEIGAEKEKLITQILSKLEKISENVLYIPGNHDPKSLYSQEPPQLTEKSKNLHMKNVKIGDNLLVLGLGGSISNVATDEKDYHKYKIADYNNIVWKGYPYINDKDKPDFFKCEELLNTDIEAAFNSLPQDNSQVILISHSGPFSSPSSTSIENNTVIYSGSISIDKLVLNNNNKIMSVCHGHTHRGKGYMKLGLSDIINPGALKFGDFGKMELNYDNINKEWRITKIERLSLK